MVYRQSHGYTYKKGRFDYKLPDKTIPITYDSFMIITYISIPDKGGDY